MAALLGACGGVTDCGDSGNGIAGSAASAPGGDAALPAGAIVVARQGAFAVGGAILGDAATSSLHCDHGVVEFQIPVNARAVNLLMWHSASAVAWQQRWDGGEGFQSIFLRRDAELLMLREAGLVGSTHIPFADMNNVEVADLLSEYLARKGLDAYAK